MPEGRGAGAEAGARSGKPEATTVIAVFNQKGGIGKTTTSTNLAVCLAAMGFETAVIDLDSQGNATSSLGVVPAPPEGAHQLLFTKNDPSALFHPTLYPRLSVCPSNDLLATAEIELSTKPEPHMTLKRRLAERPLPYRFIVIDCPPAFGMLPINALTAASRAIMPVTAEPLAHHGLQKAWTNIKRVKAHLNPSLAKPELLVTMTDQEGARTGLVDTIHNEFGAAVFNTDIPRDQRVIDAAVADAPVCLYDPGSSAARAHLHFAVEFLSRERKRSMGIQEGKTFLAEGRSKGPLQWADFDGTFDVLRKWNEEFSLGSPQGDAWTVGESYGGGSKRDDFARELRGEAADGQASAPSYDSTRDWVEET
ncbi:MAG: ParA family protein [Rhodospirillaceae bacterium]